MKSKELNPVIGPWMPYNDPFKTKFREFDSETGIRGLASVESGRIEFLAFLAREKGTGQFRELVRQCKAHYSDIRIWGVMNETIRPVLRRYGFDNGFDIDEYGDIQEVWDWKKSRPHHQRVTGHGQERINADQDS